MPKQTGILPVQGTIGNLTFSKRGKKNLVQERTHVAPDRFLSDKRFERARENAAEFTVAANGGKIFRQAFKGLMTNFGDNKVSRRLHSIMTQVVKSDPINARGRRTLVDGDKTLLQGFEFNAGNVFKEFFDIPLTASIDRTAGTLNVDVPAFIPLQKLKEAPGSTHFRITAAAAEINFAGGGYVLNVQESAALIWGERSVGPVALRCTVTPGSAHTLFLVVGIQFYQDVNRLMYPLKGSEFSTMSILQVDDDV